MATAMDTPMAHSGITTATIGAGQGIRWIRRLVLMNLGLVALQALSAGFLMSGYGRAVTIHAGVAHALQLGALTQAVAAVVLWRRRRVPAWVARDGIGLVVTVLLQVGLGYTKQYWLHVPIGVGLLGWLIRQSGRLDTLLSATWSAVVTAMHTSDTSTSALTHEVRPR
jgi:hypothetical protein